MRVKQQARSIAVGAALLAGIGGNAVAQQNVTGVNDQSSLQHQRLTGTSDMTGSTTGIINGRVSNPNTNGNDITPSLMDFGFGTDMANQGPFVTMSDKQFARGLASRGKIAIELGRIATERAMSPDVKQLGQRMVDDYTNWTGGMNRASAALGIKLPSDLDPKQRATVKSIEGLSGTEFDAAYLKEMIALDNRALTIAQYEATNAGVSGFRHWSGVMVPHIQDHLKLARQGMAGNAVVSRK